MYDRYWDIHLKAGSEFDFPNDIAEYARYQRQIKTQNKIIGPALMLIEQFGSWGASAALLLNRFNGIEVWIEADRQTLVTYGLGELMRGLHIMEPDKNKSIELKLPGPLSKMAKS